MEALREMSDEFPELFPASLVSTIQTQLKVVQVAEDEIAKAKGRYPADVHRKIWGCFRQLQPRAQALASREKLYRAHCRELIDRAAKGHDLRPGTAAEALLCLVETSFIGPLNEAGFALYSKLFYELFPDDAAKLTDKWERWAGREEWPGQNDEQLLAIRIKLAHHRWLDPKRPKRKATATTKPKPLRDRYADLCKVLGLRETGATQ